MDTMPFTGNAQEHLVSEIYRAAAGAAPFSAVLRALAEITASDSALWGTYDLRRGASTIVHSFSADGAFAPAQERPEPAATSALPGIWEGQGAVWPGSRPDEAPQPMAGEALARTVAPGSNHHTLHILVSVEGDTAVHAVLARPRAAPDYGDAEIAFARNFVYHARRARDLERASIQAALLRAGLTEIIEDAALGVAVLDPPSVLFLSPSCRDMLDALADGSGDGLLLTDATAAPSVILMPRALADAIDGHDRRTTANIIVRRVGDGRGRYVAQLRPFPLKHGRSETVGLALILFDPDQRVAVNEDLLKSAYGLTHSEVRVCALLANGNSVDGIATQLRISPYTARTHLKRIFHKTGSARQAELVKLVLNLAKLRRTGAGLREEIERSDRLVRSLQAGLPAPPRA